MSVESNGLPSIIETARDETGGSLKDFTVLSVQVDPYRLDTPASHKASQWFKDQMDRLNLWSQRLHTRDIHYAFSGAVMLPDGRPYINDEKMWAWLENVCKAARWLGYVPFYAVPDARNDCTSSEISGQLGFLSRRVSGSLC